MIITKAPFRVSFAGGGSDIASFYEKNGGCVLSTTIDKYVYLSIHPSFHKNETILRYKKSEVVENINELSHDIVKACLENAHLTGVEIHSDADVPAGSGLGSSSAFTVALLEALEAYKNESSSKEKLAQEACDIEIKQLGNPIGKQDQYAASYGGLNFYRFHKDGSVTVENVKISDEAKIELKKNLLLFYIGGVHDASKILAEQTENNKKVDKEKSLKEMCHLAERLKYELEHDNIDAMGDILHQNWRLKRTLASGISSPMIDGLYEKARQAGAMAENFLERGEQDLCFFM